MENTKYKLLQKAVLQGDLENVKACLEQFDLSNSSTDGELYKKKKRAKLETLTEQQQFDVLRKAINKSHQEIVKLLLEKGFNVSHDNLKSSSTSLIQAAIKAADPEVLKLLIGHNDAFAKLEKRVINALLLEAIKTKNVDVVKVILEKGADINSSDKNGFALHQAIRLESSEIVSFLLEKGADVNGESLPLQYRPIHEAIKTRNSEIFDIVLQNGADLSVTLSSGTNLLAFSAGHGNSEIVAYLLNQGMGIDVRDQTDRPPLIYAIQNQREELVEFLLQKGTDANVGYIKSANGSFEIWTTALYVATELGNAKIVKSLLNHGSNVSLRGSVGNRPSWTPLLIACKKGFLSVVQVLVDHGALADYLQNDTNSTSSAIDFAIENGHKEIVQLLLDKKSFYISSYSVGIASERGHIETIKYLFGKEFPIDNALHAAAYRGKTKIVKFLLDQGVNVNSYRGCGTPLHFALRTSNPKPHIVKMLLNAGADISIMSEYSLPTIHYCAYHRYDGRFIVQVKQIIDLLLDYGADINETDSNGRMLLQLDELERIDCLRCNIQIQLYLIKRGADFNAAGTQENTIVHRSSKLNAKWLLRGMIHAKYLNGITISDNILQYVQRNNELNKYFAQCNDEVEKMKEERLNNTDVSLFDVFKTSSFGQLSAYARNNNIVEYFEAKVYQRKFPKYAAVIEEHFQPALFQRKLIDEGNIYFRLLFGGNMPVTCRDQIFSYLSTDDLINLSKACRSKNRSCKR